MKKIILALILLVITFPVIRPGFNLQIDPQIHWVFNHLFQNDFSKTQQLIFPHGALTFINFPLAMGGNLFWGILIQAVLRFGFIFSFLHLGSLVNGKRTWLHFILAFFLLEFMELDFIIAGFVANALFINYYTRKIGWFILATCLAALGFYIKMSIGIISFSMIIPFSFFLLFEKPSSISLFEKIKNLSLRLFSIPIALVVGWFLMYQNLEGLGKYFYGALELVKGNSDSASLYPDNNWWWLGLSFLAFSVIPFLPNRQTGFEKKKIIWLVYFVLGFSMFAVWKHGMARQDPWHIIKVFAWGMVFLAYVFLLNKSDENLGGNLKLPPKLITTVFSIVALFAFYMNIQSSLGQFVDELGTDGYKNFANAFLHQKDLFEKNKNASFVAIQASQLTQKDLQLIENQTIDCYPWNYAFVANHQLNWQPRPVIQSYAAYTPWLDAQNANHFLSENAPQFLIWENDILKRDIWESELTSIDNRYLLNDEPQTIAAIFSNYKLIKKNDVYLLLEKTANPLLQNSAIKNTVETEWNQWIEVPYFDDGILRAKINFEGTFLKWLKSKTYKDEPLFIEYKLENGEIRKYRFTAQNATEGLWINPFISKPSSNFINPITTKIRLSCGNDFLVKNEIQITWQFFPIKKIHATENYQGTFELFGKTKTSVEKIVLEKTDALENAVEIASGGYSPAYEISLDEFLNDSTNYSIAAQVNAQMPNLGKALLVISIEKDGKSVFWEGKEIENFMTIFNRWETAFFKRKIPNMDFQNATLKIYVWNSGKTKMEVKNMEMKILQKQLIE